MSIGAKPALRLFAGEVDPTDPNRFSIRYELNGESGVIDGKLAIDENVELTPSGPLAKEWQVEQRKRSG